MRNKIDSTNIDSTNGNDQTYHGTIIRTEIEKSIELGMALKWSATHDKQKQKYFSLPYHQLAENQILVFVL